MSRYKELTVAPARQSPRNVWASQILHRQELIAPQYGEAILMTAGHKPRRARSTIILGPLQGPAPGRLQPKPVPNLGAFSQQVLGPEVKQ